MDTMKLFLNVSESVRAFWSVRAKQAERFFQRSPCMDENDLHDCVMSGAPVNRRFSPPVPLFLLLLRPTWHGPTSFWPKVNYLKELAQTKNIMNRSLLVQRNFFVFCHSHSDHHRINQLSMTMAGLTSMPVMPCHGPPVEGTPLAAHFLYLNPNKH